MKFFERFAKREHSSTEIASLIEEVQRKRKEHQQTISQAMAEIVENFGGDNTANHAAIANARNEIEASSIVLQRLQQELAEARKREQIEIIRERQKEYALSANAVKVARSEIDKKLSDFIFAYERRIAIEREFHALQAELRKLDDAVADVDVFDLEIDIGTQPLAEKMVARWGLNIRMLANQLRTAIAHEQDRKERK